MTSLESKYYPAIALFVTIFINGTVGNKVGEIANSPEQRLTFEPVNATFSIWSVIYTAVADVVLKQITNPEQMWDDMSINLFVLSCVLNCAWIIAWTSERLVLSQFILYGLAASLIYLWYINKNALTSTQNCLAIYVAWVLGASILNTCKSLKVERGVKDSELSRGALVIFCAIHIAWPLIFMDRLDECLPVAFVGAFTTFGILSRNTPDSREWVLGLAVTLMTSYVSARRFLN